MNIVKVILKSRVLGYCGTSLALAQLISFDALACANSCTSLCHAPQTTISGFIVYQESAGAIDTCCDGQSSGSDSCAPTGWGTCDWDLTVTGYLYQAVYHHHDPVLVTAPAGNTCPPVGG
jgi:hypothetical protein